MKKIISLLLLTWLLAACNTDTETITVEVPVDMTAQNLAAKTAALDAQGTAYTVEDGAIIITPESEAQQLARFMNTHNPRPFDIWRIDNKTGLVGVAFERDLERLPLYDSYGDLIGDGFSQHRLVIELTAEQLATPDPTPRFAALSQPIDILRATVDENSDLSFLSNVSVKWLELTFDGNVELRPDFRVFNNVSAKHVTLRFTGDAFKNEVLWLDWVIGNPYIESLTLDGGDIDGVYWTRSWYITSTGGGRIGNADLFSSLQTLTVKNVSTQILRHYFALAGHFPSLENIVVDNVVIGSVAWHRIFRSYFIRRLRLVNVEQAALTSLPSFGNLRQLELVDIAFNDASETAFLADLRTVDALRLENVTLYGADLDSELNPLPFIPEKARSCIRIDTFTGDDRTVTLLADDPEALNRPTCFTKF